MLETGLLELLGETDKPAILPVARVRAALSAELARSPDLREMLEDEIDWDLEPFLEGLRDWSSVYTVAFVKRLAVAMELDWRAVLQGIATG